MIIHVHKHSLESWKWKGPWPSRGAMPSTPMIVSGSVHIDLAHTPRPHPSTPPTPGSARLPAATAVHHSFTGERQAVLVAASLKSPAKEVRIHAYSHLQSINPSIHQSIHPSIHPINQSIHPQVEGVGRPGASAWPVRRSMGGARSTRLDPRKELFVRAILASQSPGFPRAVPGKHVQRRTKEGKVNSSVPGSFGSCAQLSSQ